MQYQNSIKGIKSIYTLENAVKFNEYSDIWEGIDQKTKIKVAIKKQRNIESTELSLLKKFSETNGFKSVVNIFEVIEGENSEYFLIMEYANGGDLLRYLEKNSSLLNIQQKKQIMIHVANGLVELHQQNLVHRNISPENILVFKENDKVSFKINDFGLTKRNDNTKTIKIGTPQYKAPELIKDNKNKFNYKSEVDIWALGCVYYEIIARESLFIGNSVEDLEKKIIDTKQEWINGQIDKLNDQSIEQQQRQLLKLMISIQPSERPKIFDVIQTLQGSFDFLIRSQQRIIPKINPIQNIPQNPIIIPQHNRIINPPPNITSQQQPKIQIQNKIDVPKIIKREGENKLEQVTKQEENLINKHKLELEQQEQQMRKKFEQQQMKTEEENKKELELLQQQNNQLKLSCDQQQQLQTQLEKQKLEFEEQMVRNLSLTQQQLKDQLKQQEQQISQFQQIQIEQQKAQLQAFQSQKDSVIKLISELEQINIQNDEDDNLLNEVKSRFKENFAQFEQIEQNNYSSQQLSEKTQLLNQLHSQCKELQGKAQMEVKQMQKQVEQVKEEFQVEVQAQLQKIEHQSKDISIDPYLKQDIERINQKYKDQLQQNNEHKGSDSLQQRITNIKNTKQQLMTECNSIIEKLLKISSQSNSANQYLNQAITNYRSKLDKAIKTITERLPYIQQILTELMQIQSKTNEISNLIQNLQKGSQQYTGQLSKYQELKQKQFDQTQFAQIQEDSENVIKEQGKIETEFQYLQKQYSQVCEQYKTNLVNKIVATKPQLENQYLQIQELIKEKKNSMNNKIAYLLKECLTEKTQEECDKILEETLKEQKLLNDSQQFINTVEAITLQDNSIEQKSFSDIDMDLEKIDQQVRNMQQYTQDLKESQEKDLDVLEQAIRYIKKNPDKYVKNQVQLRKYIKDQALIRRILQMKDQSMDNQLILREIMMVFKEIQHRILCRPEK